MGKQSSRIIWGRTGEDGNAKTPVEMYDPTETIYVKDNMALVKEKVNDKEEINCYICKAIESAGEWDAVKEEWRKLQSVSKYDSKKEYKKNSKCIYNDYYWNCTHDITRDDIMRHINDDTLLPTSELYWEHVMQTVAVSYHAMDHKEVFYDDGRNQDKWHKAMWFVPDEEYFDETHDEEIAEWEPTRQYEKGNQVIRTYNYTTGTVKKLYECRVMHTTPGDTSWHVEEWKLLDDVEEWDHHVAYAKGTLVIRSDIPVGEFNIVRFKEFGDFVKFKSGDKCINYIDRDDKTSADPDIRREYSALPEWVKTKVEKVGTHVNSLYQLKSGVFLPDLVNFQREEWVLIGQAFDLFIERDYSAGDSVIWSYSGSDPSSGGAFQSVCVFTAKEDLPAIRPEQTPTADPSKWGEPWRQNQTATPIPHLYRARKNLTPNMNDKWRKENWVVQSQKMKNYELDCYGWVWKKLSDPSSHGAPFGNHFSTYGGSRYLYDSKDSTDRRGRMASFYLTSTDAIFEAPTQYSFRTVYEALNGYLRKRVASGTGFTYVKIFMDKAYGFPLWDSTDENYGYRNYTSGEYINYFYIRLFDGWKRIDIGDYIRGDCFTPFGTGFQAYTEWAFDTQGQSNKNFLRKLTFSEDQLIYNEAVPFVLSEELNEYDDYYSSSELSLNHRTFFSKGNFVFFVAYRKSHATHYNSVRDYHEPSQQDPTYHLEEYKWPEYYILCPSGQMKTYAHDPYLKRNMFGSTYKPNFMVTHLQEHIIKVDYPDTEIDYTIRSAVGLDAIETALNNDGYTLVEVPRPDISPTYIQYFAHGWFDYIYTEYVCDSLIFSDLGNDTTYQLWHLSYEYKLTEADTSSIVRSVFWLQRIDVLGNSNIQKIFDEEESITSSETYLDTALPLGKLYEIGRVNTKFYFTVGSADGTSSGYHDGCGIYELDLDSSEIVQIEKLETRAKYEDGIFIKNIRYINNGSVRIYDFWGHGGPAQTYHTVSKLNLCLVKDYFKPHSRFEFDDENESLSLCVPLTDDNNFAISTGTAASVYTGDIFLHDHLDVYHTLGVFIHIRNFNMKEKIFTAFQSFFWMSAGNDVDAGMDFGDFYGGFDRAPYNFRLPIVF